MTPLRTRIESFLRELVGPRAPELAVVAGKVLLGLAAVALVPIAFVAWGLFRVLAALHGLGDRTLIAASHFINPGRES